MKIIKLLCAGLLLFVASTSFTYPHVPLCAACDEGSYHSREQALAVCHDKTARVRAEGRFKILIDCKIDPDNSGVYIYYDDFYNRPTKQTSTAFATDCAINGQIWDDKTHGCVDPPQNTKNNGGCKTCPKTTVGNPINYGVGNKYQKETDFEDPFSDELTIVRHYNSRNNVKSRFGYNWTDHFDRRLVQTGTSLIAYREDGKQYEFTESAGVYVPDADIKDTLSNAGSGWQYGSVNGDVEVYDSNGKLTAIRKQDGREYLLSYDANQRLISVTDPLGRSLTYSYNTIGLVSQVQTPGGIVYQYGYTTYQNLSKVIFPDGTPGDNSDNPKKTYLYENYTGHNPLIHALTGIIDERGIRYATFEYDTYGRATASYHAGGAQRVNITYYNNGSRTVTDSLGRSTTYNTEPQFGVPLITRAIGPGCSTCGASNASYQYDPANSNLLQETVNGVITQYGNYNALGRYGYKIEAVGTPQERRTDYTYDARFPNKIATITKPSVNPGQHKVTTYTYDNFGNRTSMTITGYAPDNVGGWVPVSRTTTFQYQGPLHQLSQIDGPLTDVSDVTTLEYYPDDASAGNNRARLKRVVGPLSIVLRDNVQYSASGKVAHEELPNGVSIDYSYYPGNDRLESTTQTASLESRTTHMTYLPTGEVHTVTQAHGTPLATIITFGYDNARRLTNVTDQLGNTSVYTLDGEGNRTAENVYDANGVLATTLSQLFDDYNRLDKQILLSGITDYDYNSDGTLHQVTDAKTNTTTYDYDALKRLTHTHQPGGVNTDYVYDVADNLVSVIDPDSHATQYTDDDLGNVLKQVSPDSGTTTYHYDVPGNLVQQTDANGQTTTYTYDALSRITQALYADGTRDQYTYDSGVNAVGRLSQLTSLDSNAVATATVQYDYNGFGEIIQKRELVDGKTFVNQYQYNALGAISQLTYPSGTQVAYTYNGGNINSVSINGQVFLSNVTYEPSGGIRSWQAANGDMHQRRYDTIGRLTQIKQGNFSKTFSYDANHNITAIGDGSNTTNSNYGYDALNRLTDYTASTASIAYIYDPNGNRTQQTVNNSGISDITDYSIDSASNRLLDIINAASSTTRTILYDANGNTIDNGTHSFQYDSRNRLMTVDNGDLANYQYNALSQRIRKEVKGNPADVNGDGIINHLDITASNSQNAVAVDCNSDGNPANTDNGNGKSQGNGNARGQDTSCIARQIGNNPNSPNTQTGGSGGNIVSYFVYDEAGQLLAEHDDMGTFISETVYLYTIPVAVFRQGVVYTVHTDQLDTPRAISDPQGVTVWRWEGEPFGNTLADEDPDGDGVKFMYNGRLPGQYYDLETGLHYNYYRYYDPQSGRYIMSDPIGLDGGMNIFIYSNDNPNRYVDFLGLEIKGRFAKGHEPKLLDIEGRTDTKIDYPYIINNKQFIELQVSSVWSARVEYIVDCEDTDCHKTWSLKGYFPINKKDKYKQYFPLFNLEDVNSLAEKLTNEQYIRQELENYLNTNYELDPNWICQQKSIHAIES